MKKCDPCTNCNPCCKHYTPQKKVKDGNQLTNKGSDG